MAENLGTDVSFVYEGKGYNEDLVVFQKGKPPLDSELNLVQQIQNIINRKQTSTLASGWISSKKAYTSPLLSDEFYTQNPTGATPELALVNGMAINVTGTGTTESSTNLIKLGDPPSTGNRVNGIFLEVWRALLDPASNANKPDPATIIDSIKDITMIDDEFGWAVGENGLILGTENGGQTWNIELIETKKKLNSVSFVTVSLGWVVGDSGIIARTSSGGSKWTLLSSGTTENIKGIFMYSQLVGWAVGDAGTILKTTNGVNWLHQISGSTANLSSVYFYDDLVGWAVGSSGVILKTTNGGTSWSAMESITANTLNSVNFYDLNTGFAVGNNGTLIRSSDGGLTWISQSGNVYTGSSYKSVTVDLQDVYMVPSLDIHVPGEELTSQFTGSNKNCTVSNVPITDGKGKGVITNLPADVVVTVNDIEVGVDSVNGTTGQLILSAAPRTCDTVKISYYYRSSFTGFQGRVFTCGKVGTVMRTDDIGQQWTEQNSNTQYDLNGLSFSDENTGWTVGDFSIVRHTIDGGGSWDAQQNDVIVRSVQRVYSEGNVETITYLDDDSIHPDTNIETTKRVQVQYRIRVVDGVDPINFPDAGLGASSVVGFGPNTSGQFAFDNMGPLTGDYGAWRAKCSDTVDGYCWAIPMFFVNRRNSASYNQLTNTNGSNVKNTTAIRPDLLVATTIIDTDILDVRRLSLTQSASTLLDNNFDLAMSNKLSTRFFRDTFGGDKYGTEIMQVDRIGGKAEDGGELISNATLADVTAGLLSSESIPEIEVNAVTAGTSVPTQASLGPVLGLFHTNEIYYSVTYDSPTSQFDGKPVPGTFTGIGTDTVIFVFSSDANSQTEDPTLANYIISAKWIKSSPIALKHLPTTPKLVKNTSGAGSAAFWYQGVSDINETQIVEEWDSGIPGYLNYSTVYTAKDVDDTEQKNRSSTLEVHQFVTVTSTMLVDQNTILVDKNLYPTVGDVPYTLYTVSRIKNVDSDFTYKIKDMSVSDKIQVESVTGFPFIVGTLLEITSYVLSATGDANVRNGASLNFTSRLKKVGNFCKSILATGTIVNPATSIIINIPDSSIIGVSTTETSSSLTQQFCWVDDGVNMVLYPATISGFGTSNLLVEIIGVPPSGTVSVQVAVVEDALTYSDDTAAGDGILIGYYYAPYQAVNALPESLTVQMLTKPTMINISNLGSGGGTEGAPYTTPLNNIPTNNASITSDGYFGNLDPLKFNNFSVDTGFVQMPSYVPANFGEELTFSEPSQDVTQRYFYSTCSSEIQFVTEGLLVGESRKIFVAAVGIEKDVPDNKFLKGEYVLVIFSRDARMDKENFTGYQTGADSAISVYRLPNKPLARI